MPIHHPDVCSGIFCMSATAISVGNIIINKRGLAHEAQGRADFKKILTVRAQGPTPVIPALWETTGGT
ncbi:hypothetical protein AAY473_035414 [Plecturocebus cupreus]